MQRPLKAGQQALLRGALGLVLIFVFGGLLTHTMGDAAQPPMKKESPWAKSPDREPKAKPSDDPLTKKPPGSLGPPNTIPTRRISGGANLGQRQGGSCCGGLGLGGGYGGSGGEVMRTIRGTVKDAQGYPLHGVKVKAGVHRQGPACKCVKRERDRTVYTDYDDGKFNNKVDGHFKIKEVLVGYNRYSQKGKFEKFEPASGYLHIVAQDISGKQFDKAGELDTKADTHKEDGGLPAVIQLGDFTLENYYVVDDELKIHLHKDLKGKSRSHEIRPNHPVAASERYKEEVKAVTRKLASLGFHEDEATFVQEVSAYDANSKAQHAVKLFQTLWLHQGISAWFSKVDAKVGPETLRALNEADGVIWTTNAPFEADNGFTYATDNRWIHATIPDKLEAIGSKSIITSASCAIGGPYPPPPKKPIHKTHQAGGEIDIRWITPAGTPANDNQAGLFYRPLLGPNGKPKEVHLDDDDVPDPNEEWTDDDRNRKKDPLVTEAQAVAANRTWATRPEYSRAKTQTLIDQILALGPAAVYFNDPIITGVEPHEGHSNHIHFGFRFNKKSDKKPSGTDGAPEFHR